MSDRGISRLKEILQEIRLRVAATQDLDRDGTVRALESVFAFNNELGRLARGVGAKGRPALIELQILVNAVTVQLKSGHPSEAKKSLEEVDRELDRLELEEGSI